jgi:hypothetical protein
MRTETKCPKCGGFDGYEQIKNVVRGAGWYVRGQDMRVLFCRICDVEMIEYEVIIPDKPDDPKQTVKYILIFIGTLVGLILLTAVFD